MDENEQIDSWRRTVDGQHGTVSRAQANAHGFTDARILAQVTAGRWRRVGRGTIATVTGPPTPAARAHAALLTVGMPAALSHRTAARLHGMIDGEWPPTEPVHVTVPYGRSAVRRDDLEVHRSRAFAHIVAERDDLVLVGPAHTVIDLAVAEPDARSAMRTVIHLALAGKVRPARLAAAIEHRRPRRYRRACAAAISLLNEGVGSLLEAPYALDVERAHGLPTAQRQVAMPLDDITIYEDCVYRCPDGDVIVRIDGHRHHADRGTRLRDRRRGNAAQRTGRARLEFGWEEIVGEPCRTAREVAEVLRACGWAGSPRRCARCM